MASRLYPFLHFDSGVNWQHVDPTILRSLNRLGMSKGVTITVTSGFRTVAQQQYLRDHAKELGLVRGVTVAKPGTSDHNRGAAVDATVDGKPIGKVFAASAFAKVGLKYLPNDPVHVTYLSSKEGGSSAAATTAPTGTTGAAPPSSIQTPFTQPPPTSNPLPGPDVQLPGSVQYQADPNTNPDPNNTAATLWQQVAQGSLVSPETQQMLANAQLSGGQ
jgi:hypothetical protein